MAANNQVQQAKEKRRAVDEDEADKGGSADMPAGDAVTPPSKRRLLTGKYAGETHMFGGFATPGHHPSSELGNELSSSPQRVVDSSSPERGGADAASEVPEQASSSSSSSASSSAGSSAYTRGLTHNSKAPKDTSSRHDDQPARQFSVEKVRRSQERLVRGLESAGDERTTSQLDMAGSAIQFSPPQAVVAPTPIDLRAEETLEEDKEYEIENIHPAELARRATTVPIDPANPILYIPMTHPDGSRASMDRLEANNWRFMVMREHAYVATPNFLGRHPSLSPKIRYILIDWLIEVSEEFVLHRETLHLAISYLDRYLSVAESTPKEKMQLVGICALFLAAKMEEISPPQLHKYARVTAGAHTANEIRSLELVMLSRLGFRMSSLTPNAWVNLYMHNLTRRRLAMSDEEEEPPLRRYFFGPKFDGNQFFQVMSLIDIAMHHVEAIEFAPSMLAAAAVEHVVGTGDQLRVVTGYSPSQIVNSLAFLRQFDDYPAMNRPNFPAAHLQHGAWYNLQAHHKRLLGHLNNVYGQDMAV